MTLNIGKALKPFEMAVHADLDCGSFDIRIKQAAVHSEDFRAAVASRTIVSRRKKIVPEKGSMTGSFEDDVELFLDAVVVGWGKRPLTDDEGEVIEYTTGVGRELFTSTKEGKVLFGKVMQNAVSDDVFVITEEDRKNSSGPSSSD